MTEYDDKQIYWWRLLEDEAGHDTRGKILFAAYKEIHLNGFRAASLNNILARTGVTKGALYHYFPNKTELGYAVIEEVIAKRILLSFVSPLEHAENPIEALIELIKMSASSFSLQDIQLGCPLGNLAQEMSPIDEGFRTRLDAIYQQWYDVITRSFTRAQQAGMIIDEVDPQQTAVMIVATMEGCLNAGMISQDIDKLMCCGSGLIQYLNLIQK